MILDIHYYTIKVDNDRVSLLRVTIYYREELTLPYRLATTNID
jgi:hypothetical protein